MIRKFFKFIFRQELKKLNSSIQDINKLKMDLEEKQKEFDSIFANIDVGVGVNYRSPSWAVISIQGERDFIKFIELSSTDARAIQEFLRPFDRRNKTIDAPHGSEFLKC